MLKTSRSGKRSAGLGSRVRGKPSAEPIQARKHRAAGPIRIRVLVVDDHPAGSLDLGLLLKRQPDIQFIGRAASVADVAGMKRMAEPDVAVVDSILPNGTGVDAALAIRKLHPNVRVVFISRDESDAAWLAAIEAGAVALVTKSCAPMELVDAVRRAAGGAWLMPPVASRFSWALSPASSG
jgi:two-component system, NarL family, response regulator DevR